MELEKNPFAVLQESKVETSFFGLISTPMYIVHLMIAGKFIKKVSKIQNKDS